MDATNPAQTEPAPAPLTTQPVRAQIQAITSLLFAASTRGVVGTKRLGRALDLIAGCQNPAVVLGVRRSVENGRGEWIRDEDASAISHACDGRLDVLDPCTDEDPDDGPVCEPYIPDHDGIKRDALTGLVYGEAVQHPPGASNIVPAEIDAPEFPGGLVEMTVRPGTVYRYSLGQQGRAL